MYADGVTPFGVAMPQLLRTNLLLEMVLAHLRPNPFRIANVLRWRLGGRQNLVRELADRNELDADHLPLDEAVLEQADRAARRGDPVLLEIAEDRRVAERIAARIKLFDGVVDRNSSASTAMLERRHVAPGTALRALVAGLRPHQWVKNILVLAPITLAGKLGDPSALANTLLAFVAMCLVASATYLVNDIWDLADDRRHWSKRSRPLASGALPIGLALAAIPVGLGVGLGLAAMVSPGSATVLAGYLVLTVAYSLFLKRLALVDGIVLATLYAARFALGVEAASVPPSPWLFVFAMFLFASLSYAKRHVEIGRMQRLKGVTINGRGYRVGDAPLVLAVGVSAGVGAVLILVLYIINDAFAQAFYGNKTWLWGLPPLLFLLVSRIWLMCHRGEMNDDPVAFVLRDRMSLAVGVLMLACFVLACIPWMPIA